MRVWRRRFLLVHTPNSRRALLTVAGRLGLRASDRAQDFRAHSDALLGLVYRRVGRRQHWLGPQPRPPAAHGSSSGVLAGGTGAPCGQSAMVPGVAAID